MTTTYPFSTVDRRFAHFAAIPRASKFDITIGSDVWIGRDAMILSGVTVGDGALIGARAIVSRDVEPYAIIAGNPGVSIRKRYPEAVVERLITISWWNWPDERIAAAVPLLLSARIDDFLIAAEKGQV